MRLVVQKRQVKNNKMPLEMPSPISVACIYEPKRSKQRLQMSRIKKKKLNLRLEQLRKERKNTFFCLRNTIEVCTMRENEIEAGDYVRHKNRAINGGL